MARYPKANWLGEHSPKTPMSRYDIFCIHTIVGFAPAHAAHFSVHANGEVDQSRDTKYRSAANLEGNPRVLASENEDHGARFPKWSGSDVPPLTAEQVTAGSRGLAYHRQGIDGNFGTKQHPFPGRVPGGEVWTSSPGKVCPGDKRIAQLPEILRQAKAIHARKHPEEKPVTPAQEFKNALLAACRKAARDIPAKRTFIHTGRRMVESFAKRIK
jgi:hypothetical protein